MRYVIFLGLVRTSSFKFHLNLFTYFWSTKFTYEYIRHVLKFMFTQVVWTPGYKLLEFTCKVVLHIFMKCLLQMVYDIRTIHEKFKGEVQ